MPTQTSPPTFVDHQVLMMGMANPKQKASGLHFRLWARALVAHDPATGKRFAFVSLDAGMGGEVLKNRVVKALESRLPGMSVTPPALRPHSTHSRDIHGHGYRGALARTLMFAETSQRHGSNVCGHGFPRPWPRTNAHSHSKYWDLCGRTSRQSATEILAHILTTHTLPYLPMGRHAGTRTQTWLSLAHTRTRVLLDSCKTRSFSLQGLVGNLRRSTLWSTAWLRVS
jgi:hypothetical protein